MLTKHLTSRVLLQALQRVASLKGHMIPPFPSGQVKPEGSHDPTRQIASGCLFREGCAEGELIGDTFRVCKPTVRVLRAVGALKGNLSGHVGQVIFDYMEGLTV